MLVKASNMTIKLAVDRFYKKSRYNNYRDNWRN